MIRIPCGCVIDVKICLLPNRTVPPPPSEAVRVNISWCATHKHAGEMKRVLQQCLKEEKVRSACRDQIIDVLSKASPKHDPKTTG